MTERGKYIVIEGGDGTGKSLQVNRLNAHLNELGIATLTTINPDSGVLEPVQEPGGTERANELRRRIKDASIERTPWENVEWFTEARQSNWHELIEPALSDGIWVPTARNYYSTIAYQGYGEGISIKEIENYTRQQVSDRYMTPDAVCILALKNEAVRLQRIAGRADDSHRDTFESKSSDFQLAMQAGYIDYAEKHSLPIVDAGQHPDKVFADIWKHVQKIL